jgi:hypothetical protein
MVFEASAAWQFAMHFVRNSAGRLELQSASSVIGSFLYFTGDVTGDGLVEDATRFG